MASVPVSLEKLEQIVEVVAHNLYAKWAEEGRFSEEEIAKYAGFAADDAVFVINSYMELFNQSMIDSAESIGIPAETTVHKNQLVHDFE